VDANISGVMLFQSYSATFKNVPANGEKVNAYVTCGDAQQWVAQFFLSGASSQRFDLDRCQLDPAANCKR